MTALVSADELKRFLDTWLYEPEAFLVDEIVRLDREARVIEARLDTKRALPYARLQRENPQHPGHVAAGDLLMATGSLGFLHAWFFHGCRWDEGWSGFGNRIHRADFKRLAYRESPLVLQSKELRVRVGPRRVVLRCEFRFSQQGELVYLGEQTAMFFKERVLDPKPA